MEIGAGVATPIDWQYYIRTGKAYGAPFTVAPVAGQLPYVQIFDQLAAPVNILVHRIHVTSNTAQGLEVRWDNAQRPPLLSAPLSFYYNALAPWGLIFGGTSAAPNGTLFGQTYRNANNAMEMFMEWGPLLVPGSGINVYGNTVNTNLIGAIEWVEIPV